MLLSLNPLMLFFYNKNYHIFNNKKYQKKKRIIFFCIKKILRATKSPLLFLFNFLIENFLLFITFFVYLIFQSYNFIFFVTHFNLIICIKKNK